MALKYRLNHFEQYTVINFKTKRIFIAHWKEVNKKNDKTSDSNYGLIIIRRRVMYDG